MTEFTLERPRPRIDHPDELDRMVRQIVDKVDPVAIYLFGSRARGDADAESDYDLMIVVPDVFPAGHANTHTRPFEPSKAGASRWTLPCRARRGSRSAAIRSGRSSTKSIAKGSCCMNAAIVRESLDHVEADLDAGWSCARGPRARRDRAAYLVQQAAEKLVKAMLVSVDVDPPRTHDIAEVIAELPRESPFRDRLAALSVLTPYATGFRYPTPREPPPLPSREGIDDWITEIETLKADFERWLNQRAGETEGDG